MQQINSQLNIRNRKTAIASPTGKLHSLVLATDGGFSVMSINENSNEA